MRTSGEEHRDLVVDYQNSEYSPVADVVNSGLRVFCRAWKPSGQVQAVDLNQRRLL